MWVSQLRMVLCHAPVKHVGGLPDDRAKQICSPRQECHKKRGSNAFYDVAGSSIVGSPARTACIQPAPHSQSLPSIVRALILRARGCWTWVAAPETSAGTSADATAVSTWRWRAWIAARFGLADYSPDYSPRYRPRHIMVTHYEHSYIGLNDVLRRGEHICQALQRGDAERGAEDRPRRHLHARRRLHAGLP